MINKAKFYSEYRKHFEAALKQGTVDSIDAIINTFEKSDDKIRPLEKLAYALATVRHEVGAAMLPITENLNYTSAKRIMQVWPSRFPTIESAKPYVKEPRLLGNKVYGLRLGNGLLEGFKFRGRGIGGQITGYVNYKKFGDLLGVDLCKDPDLANRVDIGAKILYIGLMTKKACTTDPLIQNIGTEADGEICVQSSFTGKSLKDYITENNVDFINARNVVNADVKRNGVKIAEDAEKFLEILKSASL